MPPAPSHPLSCVLPVIHHESAFGINAPAGLIESRSLHRSKTCCSQALRNWTKAKE